MLHTKNRHYGSIELKVLTRHPNPQDPNPAEHLWDVLKRYKPWRAPLTTHRTCPARRPWVLVFMWTPLNTAVPDGKNESQSDRVSTVRSEINAIHGRVPSQPKVLKGSTA